MYLSRVLFLPGKVRKSIWVSCCFFDDKYGSVNASRVACLRNSMEAYMDLVLLVGGTIRNPILISICWFEEKKTKTETPANELQFTC